MLDKIWIRHPLPFTLPLPNILFRVESKMRGELVTSPHDKDVWKREVVQNYFKKQPPQEFTFIKKAE